MNKQKWTTNNIPDLSGKVIIVTGGNSGLGYESVKAFATNGAIVVMACRDLEKGLAAKNDIMNNGNGGIIDVLELDLMDLSSITSFVNDFKREYDRLDVLLNNAGIMTSPYFLTKDGFEAQLGTNHLGHFALTGQLMEMIKKTRGSRVVNVSSGAHKWGKMDFENLLFENGKGYTRMRSYSQSKLANLLFTYELQRYFEKHNIESHSLAAHPGSSRTNLDRYIKDKFWYKLLRPVFSFMTQDQAQGALPQIRASVDPEAVGNEYYGPSGFMEMKGDPVLVKSTQASQNLDDARSLWELSENLTGIKY